MRILFDQGTPVPLRRMLTGHQVDIAYERGWAILTNGDLLTAAEREGFDVLITTDQNLRYQQNLSSRKIAIIVLLSTSWPRIQQHLDVIRKILDGIVTGTYHEITIPR